MTVAPAALARMAHCTGMPQLVLLLQLPRVTGTPQHVNSLP